MCNVGGYVVYLKHEPVTVHFVCDTSSERYQHFKSWIDYTVQVVKACIRLYGKDVFEKTVFGAGLAHFGFDYYCLFVKTNIPPDPHLGSAPYKHVQDDLYILKKYGRKHAERIIGKLEDLFPNAKSELIWI